MPRTLKRNTVMIHMVMIVAVLALSGCQTGMTEEEIIGRILEVNTNLPTYALDMTLDMSMKGQMMEQIEEMDGITTRVITKGKIDRVNSLMHIEGTIEFDMMGMRTEMDTEIYLIGDTIYYQVMGQWISSEFVEDFWEDLDQVDLIVAQIKNGSFVRLEDAIIDGREHYVYEIHPDLGLVMEMLLEDEDFSQLVEAGVDIYDVVRDYHYTVSIDKETLIITRSAGHLLMVLSKGTDPDEPLELSIDMDWEVTIYDVGEEVIITLPEEAKNVMDLSQLTGGLQGSDEPIKKGNSITGGAIADFLS